MSTHIKFILPLLGENIAEEDFSRECGFVDAYLHDKNRPMLDSHLFLLYSTKERSYKRALTIQKLKSSEYYYGWTTVRLNGEVYLLIIMKMVSQQQKELHKGMPCWTTEYFKRLLTFWNYSEDVCDVVLRNFFLYEPDYKELPEEDYSPPDLTTDWGYEESLTIEK